MVDLIQARTLKGFRDYLPTLMIVRERLLETARQVYRSWGFLPIDTPALEYADILLGKGGEDSDKLIYRFLDHGGRDVALRFDLTIPFARFAAQHVQKFGTPFKRYHMGPVWRGENTAHGRYREFWQCDFDTIGTKSNVADIEVALVIHSLLRALGVERFKIHLNNRLILNGLLQELGLAGQVVPILRALDKISKIGRDAVQAEIVENGRVESEKARRVLDLVEIEGNNETILEKLKQFHDTNSEIAQGVTQLREMLRVMQAAGVEKSQIQIDLSIARGLDYYTGTVYETFLTDLPGIGSVCSGGRYDNLAKLFTKVELPGVGASLGLDRLLAALEELNLLKTQATGAPVLIVQFTSERLSDYFALSSELRSAGIANEVYPDTKKIGQQLQYAERRGFRIAIIAGPEEFARGEWKVKDLFRREEQSYLHSQVIAAVRKLLLD